MARFQGKQTIDVQGKQTINEAAGKKLKDLFIVPYHHEETRGSREMERHEETRGSREMERHEETRGARGRREGFQSETSTSDWLLGTLLFVVVLFALSPGVLLTLPPGRGKVWMSGQTSMAAAFVHALLIALLFSVF